MTNPPNVSSGREALDMRLSRRRLIGLGIGASIVGAAGVAGCGSGSRRRSSSDPNKLRVWLMQAPTFIDDAIPAIHARFEKDTGVKIELQVQQWDNINTKLATALASDDPPDIVEMGNTNVSLFAANGALLDLTKHSGELHQEQKWLPGLERPATVDEKLFASPLHAGTQAVIYNKTMWSKARLSGVPSTFEDLTSALDSIRKAHPAKDFSPFYFAGGNWYAALAYLFDAEGGLARYKDGTWTELVSSQSSIRGLEQFRKFQNQYSASSSTTATWGSPDRNIVLANEKAAAIIATNPSSITEIEGHNPELKGHLGSFPMPSVNSAGENMPAWLGGTVLGISAKCGNVDAAVRYLKLLASPAIQLEYVNGVGGDLPTSVETIRTVEEKVGSDRVGFYQAALKDFTVPSAPGWSVVETDNSIQDMFTQVATGRNLRMPPRAPLANTSPKR